MGEDGAVDFWFAVGSTYTYLSVMRVPEVERASGVAFRWQPFNMRRIMREVDNCFLQGKPEKYAYMWRDIARRAEMFGIPAQIPVPHPLKEFDTATRAPPSMIQRVIPAHHRRPADLRHQTQPPPRQVQGQPPWRRDSLACMHFSSLAAT